MPRRVPRVLIDRDQVLHHVDLRDGLGLDRGGRGVAGLVERDQRGEPEEALEILAEGYEHTEQMGASLPITLRWSRVTS